MTATDSLVTAEHAVWVAAGAFAIADFKAGFATLWLKLKAFTASTASRLRSFVSFRRLVMAIGC